MRSKRLINTVSRTILFSAMFLMIYPTLILHSFLSFYKSISVTITILKDNLNTIYNVNRKVQRANHLSPENVELWKMFFVFSQTVRSLW